MTHNFGLALLALSCAAALFVITPAHGQQEVGEQARTQQDATSTSPMDAAAIARVPLLIVDRTGSTLMGPSHMHLLLYSDGHVAYVSRSGAPGDAHDFHVKLQPAAAKELHSKLMAKGAKTLANQTIQATDVPLTTVTFLEAASARTGANTFSYWVGEGAYQAIEVELAQFVTTIEALEPSAIR